MQVAELGGRLELQPVAGLLHVPGESSRWMAWVPPVRNARACSTRAL
jgi:hypothetical protein